MGTSTAGRQHASHQAQSTKRKEPPAAHTPPRAKKAAASVPSSQSKPTDNAQQALRERHRQAVSALYAAFEQLNASSNDADSRIAAFDALLEGAKGKRDVPAKHQTDKGVMLIAFPHVLAHVGFTTYGSFERLDNFHCDVPLATHAQCSLIASRWACRRHMRSEGGRQADPALCSPLSPEARAGSSCAHHHHRLALLYKGP